MQDHLPPRNLGPAPMSCDGSPGAPPPPPGSVPGAPGSRGEAWREERVVQAGAAIAEAFRTGRLRFARDLKHGPVLVARRAGRADAGRPTVLIGDLAQAMCPPSPPTIH